MIILQRDKKWRNAFLQEGAVGNGWPLMNPQKAFWVEMGRAIGEIRKEKRWWLNYLDSLKSARASWKPWFR